MTDTDPIEDTTLVLVLTRATRDVHAWVERLDALPQLRDCPLVVLYDTRGMPALAALSAKRGDVSAVRMPDDDSPDRIELAKAYAAVFRGLSTRFFGVVTVPRKLDGYLERVIAQVRAGVERVDDIGLEVDTPILLHTRHEAPLTARAYLWDQLAERTDNAMPPVLRDYLGYLVLLSGVLSLEGIDPVHGAGEVELFARVAYGRFNGHQPPPWRYRLVIAGAQGNVHAEGLATVTQRIDSRGDRRWENLRARIPMTSVPDGHHRIMVSLETPFESLRALRPLAPRPGVLACARTFRLTTDDPGTEDVTRYLAHTVRSASTTWLTVQHGAGADAKRKWYRTLLKKDLKMILRGRAVDRRLRWARLQRLLTRPLYRRRAVWLIGERSDTAQDNALHLFRYLRENEPHRDVYYVIDRDSPQRSRVRDLGNVVAHSSWRHRLLMLHAHVLANAYSIKHMIPRQWNPRAYTEHLAWRVGAVRVYLKHGVHVSANAVKRGTGGYDLYLSVNPRETAALREYSGYRDQIVEIGMPRYDGLEPGPSTRTVLFMPTWRRYLVPKLFGDTDQALVPFLGSTYERFVRGFLTSPRLHQMLTDYDYTLQFLPHYNLLEHLSGFELTSDRTVRADTTVTSFQDLIRGCDAFVTDHSSVHFDVAYLGTPIIYTHFDRDEYAAGHASVSWFEHERDGFGPVVYTLEETLDALEELLARDCAPDPAYASRVDAAFTYRDRQNSARATAAIDHLLATSKTNP